MIHTVKRSLTCPMMINHFGDEYPAAVTINGVRMPLTSEGRWTRNYHNTEAKTGCRISRFMDGSAKIAFPEFAREWPTWNEQERRDFCSACSWLGKQEDFADMLRHIMQHGGADEWSSIALSVGSRLPQAEAFDLLARALHASDLAHSSNIIQGISVTKHPEAEVVLRAHLAALWSQPSIWDDDSFTNWLAFGAICCIKHLIAVGASPEDFDDQVRALAKHGCAGNRDSCRRFLAKHFPWLNE